MKAKKNASQSSPYAHTHSCMYVVTHMHVFFFCVWLYISQLHVLPSSYLENAELQNPAGEEPDKK